MGARVGGQGCWVEMGRTVARFVAGGMRIDVAEAVGVSYLGFSQEVGAGRW